jgi:regulator of protease activity HflC (stomatin/prohibitin superfamily)
MTSLLVFIGLIGIGGSIALFVREFYQNLAARQQHDASGEVIPPVRYNLKYPLLLVGVLSILLGTFLVQVGAQEVAVVVTPAGIAPDVLVTGWHIVPPWNHLERMDRTVWVYTFSSKQDEGQHTGPDAIWVPTKDGIKMGMNVSISWSIDPPYAPWILQNVSEADGGRDGRYRWIEENFIRAKAQSSIALTVSEYTPIQVYSDKRSEIQAAAAKRLEQELGVYHLLLRQIDIREVFYNPQYEESINNKKLAEQEALRLIEVTKQKQEQLKQSEIDKNIAIQRAEGESKALQIKGQSISNNPKIIDLEWINKWNGQLPTYLMGSGQGVMLDLRKDK